MTCIVGIETPTSVVIGGDSAGVAGWTHTHRGDPKVFRNGPYLIGFTSSFRMGQILRYADLPEVKTDGGALERFMATKFVDAIRAAFADGGYGKKESGREEGGCFLIGARGRLFRMDSDYQMGWSRDGYFAIGCGDDIALGALHSSPGMDPRWRVYAALKAAAHHSGGVRPPFTIREAK